MSASYALQLGPRWPRPTPQVVTSKLQCIEALGNSLGFIIILQEQRACFFGRLRVFFLYV